MGENSYYSRAFIPKADAPLFYSDAEMRNYLMFAFNASDVLWYEDKDRLGIVVKYRQDQIQLD